MTAYKLAVLEILRNLIVCISIYCVSALSLHTESTDSMITIVPDYNYRTCTIQDCERPDF